MNIILGMRMTAQRRAVLALIEAEPKRHWSAEEVAEALRAEGVRIGVATVYRALAALEAEGHLVSVQWHGKRRYESAQKAHHDHLVCERCGRVEEFCDPAIEEKQEKAARARGFRLTGHQLVLFGICAACQEGEGA